MGMFDEFRSSYDLGEQFTNVRCQTKQIDDYFGGTMSFYWLSPGGQLYLIDNRHIADFVEIQEGEDGYDEKRKFLNFKWIPNGTHGKVTPHNITKYVEVYPEQWNGDWKDWPRLKLHFKEGVLQDYENITGRDV